VRGTVLRRVLRLGADPFLKVQVAADSGRAWRLQVYVNDERVLDKLIEGVPVVFMEAELPFISDSDAPGVSAYRSEIGELLHKSSVQSRRHETLISDIEEAGKTFHVLVLKTNMTIPYTSLFIRLDANTGVPTKRKISA